MLNSTNTQNNQVSLWFFFNAFMVFLMVAIGGITRLSDSGLSMTDWNFFSGMIPPLNNEDWNALFSEYKRYPEFKIYNLEMTLSEFKKIFFWEYFHRMWGRLIGITFLIPFIYFLFKGFINKKLCGVVFGIFILGCFQGFMGWYMVSSGLVDKPDVSQYRLAAHLSIAFIIYTLLLFVGWNLFQKSSNTEIYTNNYKNVSVLKIYFCYVLLFITIISGAFVAGTDAGQVYNSFPLMGNSIFPDDAFIYEPVWINFFESLSLIQFNHRIIATVTAVSIVIYCYSELPKKLSGLDKFLIKSLMFCIIFQYSLGVLVVMYAVPFSIGLVHQLGSLINLSLITIIIANFYKKKHSLLG